MREQYPQAPRRRPPPAQQRRAAPPQGVAPRPGVRPNPQQRYPAPAAGARRRRAKKPLVLAWAVVVVVLGIVAAALYFLLGRSGPGPTSSSTTQVAAGFVSAVIERDLPSVRQYFAPDKQPKSWDDVFPYNPFVRRYLGASNYAGQNDKAPETLTDLGGCRDTRYSTTERSLGTGYADVTFVFAGPCVNWQKTYSRDVLVSGRSATAHKIRSENASEVNVRLEGANGRWFVTALWVKGQGETVLPGY